MFDLVQNLRIPECWSVFRSLGSDSRTGELGCGFMRKRYPHGRDHTITFEARYGALLILAGSGQYRDANGITSAIGAGDVVQRLPGLPHETPVARGEDWFECFVTFSEPVFDLLVQLGCIDPARPVFHPGVDQSLIDRFAALRQRLFDAGDAELPTIFAELESLLFRLFLLDRREDATASFAEDACALLSADLGTRLRLETDARQLRMGYESFRKKFGNELGVSPGEYRIRRRIDAARNLLMMPDKSIKEVAGELVYADPFTFSRQFKRVTGLTPTQFRETR